MTEQKIDSLIEKIKEMEERRNLINEEVKSLITNKNLDIKSRWKLFVNSKWNRMSMYEESNSSGHDCKEIIMNMMTGLPKSSN